MSSIVFPPEPMIRKNAGKTYVDNMKVMLAKSYFVGGEKLKLTKKVLADNNISQPPVGWWASTKFDGIRGVWNGTQFVSRASVSGAAKVYNYVPDFFTEHLPKGVALDGEIFCGNGNFQDTSRLSTIMPESKSKKYTKAQIDDMWRKVKFMVFDSPSQPGTFEERSEFCKGLITAACSRSAQCPMAWTQHTRIKSEEHLDEMYNKVVKKGGEGVMLRAPGTPYIEKRTNLLLKIKVADDAEAVIKGYTDGTGKYDKPAGDGHRMLGSLQCELVGTTITFGIGTGFTDEMRREYYSVDSKHYMPVGAVVNFSFMEKTRDGVPRHPVFRGIRDDVAIA